MQIAGAELSLQGLPLMAAISRQIPTTRNAPRQRPTPPSPAPITAGDPPAHSAHH